LQASPPRFHTASANGRPKRSRQQADVGVVVARRGGHAAEARTGRVRDASTSIPGKAAGSSCLDTVAMTVEFMHT